MPGKIDLSGKRFGMLTALEEVGRNRNGSVTWLCRCDCGGEKVISSQGLRQNKTTSCGCIVTIGKVTHGQSHSPLYQRWEGMIQRTTDPNSLAYQHYGGRGIKVFEPWRKFENFARDMGPSFSPGLTIDRINVDGNYEPGNVRWVTTAVQNRNKRNTRFVTWRGRTRCLADWADLLGLSYDTVFQRLTKSNWPVERALTTGADPDAIARLDNTDLTP